MSKVLTLFIFLFLCDMACVGFGDLRNSERLNTDTDDSLVKRGLGLHFVAWSDQERYIPEIRSRLEKNGFIFQNGTPTRLEVILEEGGTTRTILRILNLIATSATGSIFPFYNQVNYNIRFRVFESGRLTQSCSYDLRNNEFFGILLTPVALFRSSPSTLSDLIALSVDLYSRGCVVKPENHP
ncbi:hypothetical protein LEP1GSC058_1944 [Leptospira fainei serovar Hurstbridge str. BUT 6]|uniref:Uncharacterized protein n=1 Tax=Leptospira fainei serovar Hurstbridge str. BUT 6 TaxID=1193011 RepID=S3VG08_9LEPT|nr:hypothetical protein [Leptospira fainei]EPG75415.1 hypothetical protein LEP1GSC058_1944 [Leptospira fainei serovar Hurstbridge str. BUT 6]